MLHEVLGQNFRISVWIVAKELQLIAALNCLNRHLGLKRGVLQLIHRESNTLTLVTVELKHTMRVLVTSGVRDEWIQATLSHAISQHRLYLVRTQAPVRRNIIDASGNFSLALT